MKYGLCKKGITQYIVLYLLLICHDAAVYRQNTLNLRIMITMFCVIMFFCLRKIKKQYVFYVLAISVYLLARGEFKLWLNYAECIFITYVAIAIDEKNFCERYVRICFLFAIISLPVFVTGLINPNLLLKIFNNEINVEWSYYGIPYNMRGWLFYTVRRMELNRNNSIFTEPGIYQMLLNSALFITLFMRNKLHHLSNNKILIYVLVFTITVITTGSTTAYLALFMIYVAYIVNLQSLKHLEINSKSSLKIAKYIFIFGSFAFITLLINFFMLGEESILHTFVLKKIGEMFSDGTSGHARTSMVEICAKFAFTHFFGVGETVVSNAIKYLDAGANGAILIHSFASLGIVPVMFILWYFFKGLSKKYIPILNSLLIIALYINTSLAQSRLLYPSLLMLPIIYSSYCKENYLIKKTNKYNINKLLQ